MKSSMLYGGDLHSALDWLCLNLKDGTRALSSPQMTQLCCFGWNLASHVVLWTRWAAGRLQSQDAGREPEEQVQIPAVCSAETCGRQSQSSHWSPQGDHQGLCLRLTKPENHHTSLDLIGAVFYLGHWEGRSCQCEGLDLKVCGAKQRGGGGGEGRWRRREKETQSWIGRKIWSCKSINHLLCQLRLYTFCLQEKLSCGVSLCRMTGI